MPEPEKHKDAWAGDAVGATKPIDKGASAARDIVLTCLACGAPVPLSKAVSNDLREQFRAEAMVSLAAQRDSIEEAAASRYAAQVEELQDAMRAKDRLIEEFRANELSLRAERRELLEARRQADVEVARRVDQAEAAIREQARVDAETAAEEHYRIRLTESEIKLVRANEQLADAQRKLRSGSEELAGTAGEVILEAELRRVAPGDSFSQPGRGRRGADLLQGIRPAPSADPVAHILFERKRAQRFQEEWISKLREDQRTKGAAIGVIVSDVRPKGVAPISCRSGIWICAPAWVGLLDVILRESLLAISRQAAAAAARSDLAGTIYDYICGPFVAHVSAIVEISGRLREQNLAEGAADARNMARRDKELHSLAGHLASMYGDLEGLGAAMPRPPGMELGAGTAGPQPLGSPVNDTNGTAGDRDL